MFGLGSISRFLMIGDSDWQNFKDAVDELRSEFPGLHHHSESDMHSCQLYCDMGETRLVGSDSWREMGSA